MAEMETASAAMAKIAKDLILLSSGPTGGLAEILLPAVQPGSSIMPGNPVSDESLTAKFHDCCRFGGMLESQSMRIAERIWQLESIDNLATLID